MPLQREHLLNIFPLQKEHLNPPFFPLPLQKEHEKLLVPEPRQVPHSRAAGGAGTPGLPPDAVWPVPLQLPHLPNIFPLQKEHLKGPLLPEPLQKEQVKLEVPEPEHVPQGAAKISGGKAICARKSASHTKKTEKVLRKRTVYPKCGNESWVDLMQLSVKMGDAA